MKTTARILVCVGVIIAPARTVGHGIPMIVNVTASRLMVSNGVADSSGYASMIFVDDSDEALMDHLYIPAFSGNYALTDLPGFIIQGMAPGSGLYLQVIPRPVKNSIPAEERLLWHWSQSSQAVAVDLIGESLVIASDFSDISVPQSGSPQPPSLQIAAPSQSDSGAHKHYLDYLLEDNPTADVGAYGFFARLTSPNYSSSAPFLVILNDDVDPSQFPGQLVAAALAINKSALLPGDYNHDDAVNAADYTVWRDTLGSTTALAADGSGNLKVDQADYNLWRANFGRSASGAGSAVTPIATVPEPATLELVLPAALAAALAFFGVPKKTRRV
jgi:hypothetical protein